MPDAHTTPTPTPIPPHTGSFECAGDASGPANAYGIGCNASDALQPASFVVPAGPHASGLGLGTVCQGDTVGFWDGNSCQVGVVFTARCTQPYDCPALYGPGEDFTDCAIAAEASQFGAYVFNALPGAATAPADPFDAGIGGLAIVDIIAGAVEGQCEQFQTAILGAACGSPCSTGCQAACTPFCSICECGGTACADFLEGRCAAPATSTSTAGPQCGSPADRVCDSLLVLDPYPAGICDEPCSDACLAVCIAAAPCSACALSTPVALVCASYVAPCAPLSQCNGTAAARVDADVVAAAALASVLDNSTCEELVSVLPCSANV